MGSSRQIAPYGATAQPAIAARMAPQLRLTMIGAVCAALAVIAAVAAVVMFPSFAGAGPGLSWAVGALVSAALMLAICVIQVVVWRRAMASWSGRRVQDLRAEKSLSWIVHLVSYAVALAALFTCMAGSAAAAWSSASAVLLARRSYSSSSRLSYLAECNFCGPAARRAPSRHISGA